MAEGYPARAATRGVVIAVAALLAALLPACTPPATRAPEAVPAAPADFPEVAYRQLAAHGRPVYVVDPARSLVAIEVHRAGSLARVGHDHVLASRDLRGYVAPEDGRADLYLKLDELTVDEPELRAEAKLDTQPSPEDIAGTRRNMLRGFESERYPFAHVHIAGAAANGGEAQLDVAVSLHGAKQRVAVPVRASWTEDQLVATGTLTLRQTDFGIRPLSVLGGALQVQDAVDLRFSIRAQRVR